MLTAEGKKVFTHKICVENSSFEEIEEFLKYTNLIEYKDYEIEYEVYTNDETDITFRYNVYLEDPKLLTLLQMKFY